MSKPTTVNAKLSKLTKDTLPLAGWKLLIKNKHGKIIAKSGEDIKFITHAAGFDIEEYCLDVIVTSRPHSFTIKHKDGYAMSGSVGSKKGDHIRLTSSRIYKGNKLYPITFLSFTWGNQ